MNPDFFLFDHDDLDQRVPSIMGTSDREVSAVARAYLRNDRFTLVIVGDLDRIEDDIRGMPSLRLADIVRHEAAPTD